MQILKSVSFSTILGFGALCIRRCMDNLISQCILGDCVGKCVFSVGVVVCLHVSYICSRGCILGIT